MLGFRSNSDSEQKQKQDTGSESECDRTDDSETGSTEGSPEVGQQKSVGTEMDDKVSCLQDQITRLRAEFDNYRKRTQREWEVQRDRMTADVFKLIIPTLDNLEKAIKHGQETTDENEKLAAFHDGIILIYEQLKVAASKEGLEELDIIGQEYDPELAEAVGIVASNEVDNLVHTVVQKGWRYHNELIRPAKVLVTRKCSGS
ncbi:nucleotide exchange factor GrpE [bacterium]|nr:nucleotide exchange factor GrpE [bacterium]